MLTYGAFSCLFCFYLPILSGKAACFENLINWYLSFRLQVSWRKVRNEQCNTKIPAFDGTNSTKTGQQKPGKKQRSYKNLEEIN